MSDQKDEKNKPVPIDDKSTEEYKEYEEKKEEDAAKRKWDDRWRDKDQK